MPKFAFILVFNSHNSFNCVTRNGKCRVCWGGCTALTDTYLHKCAYARARVSVCLLPIRVSIFN